MNITLIDNQLKITWPRYPKPIHDEILARLKTVSGAEFDRAGKCWWIPIAQADRIVELFPKASFSVGALWVAMDAQEGRAQYFHASLMQLGVTLRVEDTGQVVAFGDNVSPLIQTLIDERADALRPLVMAYGAGKSRPRPPAQPLQGPLTSEDAGWQRVLVGIENAAKKEELDRVKYPKRRRKAKVTP